jgi:hypothetical protein
MLVIKAIQMCYSGDNFEELIKNARLVGWCIEMVEEYLIILCMSINI